MSSKKGSKKVLVEFGRWGVGDSNGSRCTSLLRIAGTLGGLSRSTISGLSRPVGFLRGVSGFGRVCLHKLAGSGLLTGRKLSRLTGNRYRCLDGTSCEACVKLWVDLRTAES